MKKICFYFQVHQPYRVSKYSIFELGSGKKYFEGPPEQNNRAVFEKVAKKCYLPTNRLFLELLKQHPEMRITYSITGIFLQQCEEFGEIGQEVLDSFKALANTGQVEFLAETFYHTLASLYSKEEFKSQVEQHMKVVKKLFGQTPTVFRNTELVYHNDIAKMAHDMGFKGILMEGWDHVLGDRSPNLVYRVPKHVIEDRNFGLLLKNYKLADDIAFRFSNKSWNEHPLTVEKFLDWLESNYGETINLFMDYETFGEHQWEDTGIFEFLKHLPGMALERGIGFHTPSEALEDIRHQEELDVYYHLSWADMERNLSAWLENKMQQSAMQRVFDLEEKVKAINNKTLLDCWRRLQTSDHFYYMSTKYMGDGDVHKYFSPFESPYDAFINYSNVLSDFEQQLKEYE